MEVSRSKEVVDGVEIETVVSMVCQSCKRIQARCKCNSPAFKATTAVYKRSVSEIAKDFVLPNNALSAEESKRRYDLKTAHKNAKKTDQAENIRIAAMDEDDLAKEAEDKATNSELAKWEADREREAADNVTEIRDLKKSMMGTGKTHVEIKSAVNELVANQKKRGRPAKDAVLNPVKDAVTGEFKTSTE